MQSTPLVKVLGEETMESGGEKENLEWEDLQDYQDHQVCEEFGAMELWGRGETF